MSVFFLYLIQIALFLLISLMTSSFPSVLWGGCTWDRKTCSQYGDSASNENLHHHLHLGNHLLPQPCHLGWLSFPFSLLLDEFTRLPGPVQTGAHPKMLSWQPLLSVCGVLLLPRDMGQAPDPMLGLTAGFVFCSDSSLMRPGDGPDTSVPTALSAQGARHLCLGETGFSLSNISKQIEGQCWWPVPDTRHLFVQKLCWTDLSRPPVLRPGSLTRTQGFIPTGCASYSITRNVGRKFC